MALDNLIDPVYVEMSAILNGKRPPSERTLEKQRAMFLEGYIRFAEIFAQSELGDMDIDIAKLALYVFSPEFRYQTAYKIKNMNDVYKLIEEDILNGMPIWRYFKCSKRVKQILEDAFKTERDEEERRVKEMYICKRCRYLNEKHMHIGHYCVCRSPKRNIRGYHDYTKIKKCKYFESAEWKKK